MATNNSIQELVLPNSWIDNFHVMRKFVFTAIMVSVTLTSCLSFFPDRYEKSLVYNGFRANTNTMIGTKVNIKGYYSLVDSNISASEGKYLVTYNGRILTLAGYNPLFSMRMGLTEIFFSMLWGKIFRQMNIIKKSIWN